MDPPKGKLPKGKKKTEFKADRIDNTAPVKKILDEFHHKNDQAFAYYTNVIKQRKTTQKFLQNLHFVVPGHPLHAFSDDWDGDLPSGYFEPFTYRSVMPRYITSLRHTLRTDPVTDYMKVKKNWERVFDKLRVTAMATNMAQKYESLNDEVVHCPKHLIDMAAHVDSDPDKHFSSSYNWYYAGNGNIQTICVNWIDYLLYSEFNFLHMSEFHKETLNINYDSTISFDCGENRNILETICSSQNIIALRTKHKIFLLKIESTVDGICIKKLKEIDSLLPYTSVEFDKHHTNILYITTLDSKLSIVNLDRMTARTVELKKKSLQDNWNKVISSERTMYTHIARNDVTIYDKRTNNITHTWKDLRNVTDEVNCNDITAATQREGKSIYFATDHNVFHMDVRCMGKNKPRVVQRWHHGMQCVPTYISITSFEYNKELLCLSSQWCQDMCLITNYSNNQSLGEQISGVTIPYRPPSIMDTLTEARKKMLCYDLYNPLDDRLATAITGNVLLEQGDKYVALQQNSLGDISAHVLYPEHLESFIEDTSIESLNKWGECYKKEKKKLEVSAIVDIGDIWKKLKKVPDDYKFFGVTLDKTKFDEKAISKAFEEEEIDGGLLDAWMNDDKENQNRSQSVANQSSQSLHLYYSGEESE